MHYHIDPGVKRLTHRVVLQALVVVSVLLGVAEAQAFGPRGEPVYAEVMADPQGWIARLVKVVDQAVEGSRGPVRERIRRNWSLV